MLSGSICCPGPKVGISNQSFWRDGKLVCAAAGIETEECVEAVKTENDDLTEDELEIINNDNNPNIESLELNQDESLLK